MLSEAPSAPSAFSFGFDACCRSESHRPKVLGLRMMYRVTYFDYSKVLAAGSPTNYDMMGALKRTTDGSVFSRRDSATLFINLYLLEV